MRVLDAGENGLSTCIDASGKRSEVMTDLVGAVDAGDEVLVHAGVALVRL
jgi:hydrogenase maturation factor